MRSDGWKRKVERKIHILCKTIKSIDIILLRDGIIIMGCCCVVFFRWCFVVTQNTLLLFVYGLTRQHFSERRRITSVSSIFHRIVFIIDVYVTFPSLTFTRRPDVVLHVNKNKKKANEWEKETNKSDIIDKATPGIPIEKLLQNWLHKYPISMFINFLLENCFHPATF